MYDSFQIYLSSSNCKAPVLDIGRVWSNTSMPLVLFSQRPGVLVSGMFPPMGQFNYNYSYSTGPCAKKKKNS